jgi:hypothetical protein
MNLQEISFKHTSQWQLKFRETINKKDSKVLLLYAAVAKPGQSLKETASGEGFCVCVCNW